MSKYKNHMHVDLTFSRERHDCEVMARNCKGCKLKQTVLPIKKWKCLLKYLHWKHKILMKFGVYEAVVLLIIYHLNSWLDVYTQIVCEKGKQ